MDTNRKGLNCFRTISFKKIAKDFEKCPFTGAHIIRKTEMLEHMKTCSARILLDTISSKSNLYVYSFTLCFGII